MIGVLYTTGLLLWCNPSQQPSPTQPFPHSSTHQDWGENWKSKSGELKGWDIDSLIGKASGGKFNSGKTSKGKQGINLQLLKGRQVFIHFQERKMVTWEDKHHLTQISPFCSFYPPPIFWAWCHVVWIIPLVSLGLLSWVSSQSPKPPQSPH